MKRLPLAIALVCAAAWAVPSIPRNSVKLVENNEGDAIKVSYVLSGDPAVILLCFLRHQAPRPVLRGHNGRDFQQLYALRLARPTGEKLLIPFRSILLLLLPLTSVVHKSLLYAFALFASI